MSESHLSRKERERQRHRKEIMEAAERVFAEKGYHESSIQDIASAAEFSVGTIYNFFGNKEDLFTSILKEGFQELKNETEKRLQELECPVEKIRAMITCHMEIAEKHKYMLRLLFDYNKPRILNQQQGIDEELVANHMEFLDELASVFAEAIEQGKIVPLNPRHLAIGFDGIMVRFFELFQVLDELESYTDIAPIVEEIYLDRIFVRE